jgi:hypothetical protein
MKQITPHTPDPGSATTRQHSTDAGQSAAHSDSFASLQSPGVVDTTSAEIPQHSAQSVYKKHAERGPITIGDTVMRVQVQ